MGDIISRIMEADENPSLIVPEGYNELERIIAIRPPSLTYQTVEAPAYYKQHGNLVGYENFRNINIEREYADRALLDAFRRVLFFEVAGFLANTYATKLKEEPIKGETIKKLHQAQMSLLSDADYSQAYSDIVEAAKHFSKRADLVPVNGRVGSAYASSVNYLLQLCGPQKDVEGLDVGFGARSISFSIPSSGSYKKEIESNPDFAELVKSYPYLFTPPTGYFRLRAPPNVDAEYAGKFFDRHFRSHTLMDPNEVRISGRTPEEFFRISHPNREFTP